MSDLAQLRPSPSSVRVRLRGPAAPGSLHAGYHIWGPADFYLSDFRDRYLRGEVKGVIAELPARHAPAFETFCIVPVPIAARAAQAALHCQRLLVEIQHQYKNTVVGAACDGDAKRAKRRRAQVNKTLGSHAPAIADVERMFAAHPEALVHAAPLKALWQEIARLSSSS